jgi:hypothetical protein
MAGLKWSALDLSLAVLASPVYLVLALRRMCRNYRFLRLASLPQIRCQCAEISLVGIWKCTCSHWTYRGHVLTRCPVCQSLPCVVRCYRCGLTTKLPEPE